MAVLKFLVSVALLGTVARCQDSPAYYSAYSPGGGQYSPQYSPSIVPRGTPRLVPVKVRAAASRLLPSFYYPQVPPPHHPLPSYQRPTRQLHPAYSNMHHQTSYPRLQQQYRPAITGYYRPTRQLYYNYPFRQDVIPKNVQQPVAYHAAATSAPATLKRGRVISAPSPYLLDSPSASAPVAGPTYQYTPQSIPAVSTYRPAPPQNYQIQPQIASAPVHQLRPQPQHQPQPQHYPIQYQQPNFYVQKTPVVVGPSQARPHKLLKVKKPLPSATETEDAEEEYPGDPNPQYNFSFDIKDDELTNYQNRQEERDGQTIKGSYSVVDPDGYVRTVTYTADPKNGFQAKVTREPTDVKIKFPVPTEPPAQQHQPGLKSAGPVKQGHRYVSPQQYQPQQYQHQPQYQQTSAYATPQQVYANPPAASSTVQIQSLPVSVPAPQVYSRGSRRVVIQRRAASASAPKPQVVSPPKREKSEDSQSQQSESE